MVNVADNAMIKKIVTVQGFADPFVYGPCTADEMVSDEDFLDMIQDAIPSLASVRTLVWEDQYDEQLNTIVKRAQLTPKAQTKGAN